MAQSKSTQKRLRAQVRASKPVPTDVETSRLAAYSPAGDVPMGGGEAFRRAIWQERKRWLAEVPHLRDCLGRFEERLEKLEAQQPPSSGIQVTAHDAAWKFWKDSEKVRDLANSLGLDVVVSYRK